MDPKRFFYVLLVVLALVLGGGGGGYYYALKQLNAQKLAVADKLAAAEEASQEIEKLATLKRQYDRDVAPNLTLINNALPKDKKQTEVLAQLQNIAGASGLNISTISMPSPVGVPTSTSQTVKSGQVLALPISFQLAGTYEQLQTFLKKVERLNRFTNVTNLGISRPDKTKPIVYSISLNAYIKP
jgi:Tfp pilus assembly protein PilO